MSIYKKISDFFSNWSGSDENGETLSFTASELMEISDCNVERCAFLAENKELKEKIRKIKEVIDNDK